MGDEDGRMEMGSIFVLYIQPTIPTYTHYYLKLPDVYVGIVGWIYRTKIDPISIIPSFHPHGSPIRPYIPLFPYFFEQWSSLHFFNFTEMFFPLFSYNVFRECNVLAYKLTKQMQNKVKHNLASLRE